MAIRLVFTIQREAFYIEIVGREIFYGDRIWKNKVRVIPPDEDIKMKIIKSRNKYNLTLKQFNQFFDLNEEERKEYEECKTEKELAEVCIRDVRQKGGILRKREENED